MYTYSVSGIDRNNQVMAIAFETFTIPFNFLLSEQRNDEFISLSLTCVWCLNWQIFSPCSKRSIGAVLRNKANSCFKSEVLFTLNCLICCIISSKLH